jgi:8-oxo-dGTP pyrophosphatase MutT (NUDIX family)
MESPDGPPVIERSVVRLVVIDPQVTVLLFLIGAALHPEQGGCWELPGGGIEPGRPTWKRPSGSSARRPASWLARRI